MKRNLELLFSCLSLTHGIAGFVCMFAGELIIATIQVFFGGGFWVASALAAANGEKP